jgi:hypothetical protein
LRSLAPISCRVLTANAAPTIVPLFLPLQLPADQRPHEPAGPAHAQHSGEPRGPRRRGRGAGTYDCGWGRSGSWGRGRAPGGGSHGRGTGVECLLLSHARCNGTIQLHCSLSLASFPSLFLLSLSPRGWSSGSRVACPRGCYGPPCPKGKGSGETRLRGSRIGACVWACEGRGREMSAFALPALSFSLPASPSVPRPPSHPLRAAQCTRSRPSSRCARIPWSGMSTSP